MKPRRKKDLHLKFLALKDLFTVQAFLDMMMFRFIQKFLLHTLKTLLSIIEQFRP